MYVYIHTTIHINGNKELYKINKGMVFHIDAKGCLYVHAIYYTILCYMCVSFKINKS